MENSKYRDDDDRREEKRVNNGGNRKSSLKPKRSPSESSSDEPSDRDTSKRYKTRKHRSRSASESSEDDESSDDYRKSRSKKRSKSKRKKKRSKKTRLRKRSKRSYSSSSSSSSTSSGEEEARTETVVNQRLLAKLAARGETLEERRERRSQKRAAHISSKLGYTADENPFNDPNIHEAFTWKKKKEKDGASAIKIDETLHEIEKVRQRRKEREDQFEEMERIRAEESRMRELENAEEWERKEEEFHLHQQRQRSAIRLVEGREKPIDVLAKNMLMFGLSEEEKKSRATVKYKEKYDAMEALESLEAELEVPHLLLRKLKLEELEELLSDIHAFRTLEATAATSLIGEATDPSKNPVLRYWEALNVIALDEIKFLQTGGDDGSHSNMVQEVQKIFTGQSSADLLKMQQEVTARIIEHGSEAGFDLKYWKSVLEQLVVFLAKAELSDMHNIMLARQLESLEKRQEELTKNPQQEREVDQDDTRKLNQMPENLQAGFGDTEEDLDATDEFALAAKTYSWQDKYRPRKPRYFNRVRTGYDWNKYNQAHYDKDNPPPKIVQGYKFNVFYPDLIDSSRTPTFFLERADSNEFCIIRFHAGPPYEDVAFKSINREWNRSRKRGYKCSFERGVLSLYFNFKTHWYRR
jgi:hypothetical protein